MEEGHHDNFYFKRSGYYTDYELKELLNIFILTILSVNLLSTIIYLIMNKIKKVNKTILNCIFWPSYFSLNIPFIFFSIVCTHYIYNTSNYAYNTLRKGLIVDAGGFVFFMILNFIIYMVYKRKNKLNKKDVISSSDNNEKIKVKLNKGKAKESEITFNEDDDIIINRKSINQSQHEIDIIDVNKNDTLKDSSINTLKDSSINDIEKAEKESNITSNISNDNNNISTNNTITQNVVNQNSINYSNSVNSMNNNQNLTSQNSISYSNSINSINNSNSINNKNMINQYSISNRNSINSMNYNNINNNGTISNEALLQHINYLHNCIVNNMSKNNEIPPPFYLPNYNNYNNESLTEINNNHNGNFDNLNDMNNEKSGKPNNVNTNNNNNVNILPSYLEHIQQSGTNYSFIPISGSSISIPGFNTNASLHNTTSLSEKKEKN